MFGGRFDSEPAIATSAAVLPAASGLHRKFNCARVDAFEFAAQAGGLQEGPGGAESVRDDHLGTGVDIRRVNGANDFGVGVDREARPGGSAHRHAAAFEFRTGAAVDEDDVALESLARQFKLASRLGRFPVQGPTRLSAERVGFSKRYNPSGPQSLAR